MSHELTPAMEQVITLLSNGATISAAAETVGIHRNTITNWRQSNATFTRELATAQYDRVLHFRSLVEEHAELAIATIAQILADPASSPSLRLRAALAILKQATTLPPAEPALTNIAFKRKISQIFDPTLIPADCPSCAPPPEPKTVPNSAQRPAQHAAQPRTSPLIEPPPGFVQTVRYDAPKPGRNEPCPCNSGRKYKQCCLQSMAA